MVMRITINIANHNPKCSQNHVTVTVKMIIILGINLGLLDRNEAVVTVVMKGIQDVVSMTIAMTTDCTKEKLLPAQVGERKVLKSLGKIALILTGPDRLNAPTHNPDHQDIPVLIAIQEKT